MSPIWTPASIAVSDANVFTACEIEAYEREILANPRSTEHDASRFFQRLPKFLHLGAGAEIRHEIVLAGAIQRVDFFRRSYGERFWDLIELKGPQKRLVSGSKSLHPHLSADVERAISQALDYRDLIGHDSRIRTDLARKGITVWRPQITVVVGQDRGEVDPETLRLLYDRARSRGFDTRSYTDIYTFAKEHYARSKIILIPSLHFSTDATQSSSASHLTTVSAWLRARGRAFPKPDSPGGSIRADAFEEADIPLIVSCTSCMMTMPCSPGLPCDQEGQVFCFDCAESDVSLP